MDDLSPVRTAIFGGSFDPIHRGHLAMAEAAIEALSLDRLVFMPCFVSPFKTGTIASGDARKEMIDLSLEEVALPKAEVSDFEINRDQPSYSWETATHFHENEPTASWFWILGTDQWESIERWAEPERLRTLLHFIVLTRHGDEVKDRPGWSHTALEFEHPASSTAIRNDFEACRDWMTPSVVDFCRRQGLYAEPPHSDSL